MSSIPDKEKWIFTEGQGYLCPYCGASVEYGKAGNFCPNCGERMIDRDFAGKDFVRCADCRYCGADPPKRGAEKNHCFQWGGRVRPDQFCYMGEEIE